MEGCNLHGIRDGTYRNPESIRRAVVLGVANALNRGRREFDRERFLAGSLWGK